MCNRVAGQLLQSFALGEDFLDLLPNLVENAAILRRRMARRRARR
jgi:hypothetical protein